MRKTIFTLLLVSIFGLQIFANPITVEEAQKVAKNFLYENESINQLEIKFSEAIVVLNLYYVFNLENRIGFIIVSATDNYTPVIAYSTESYYSSDKQAPQFVGLMEDYSAQIEYTISNNIKANETVEPAWLKYNCSAKDFSFEKGGKDVAALLGSITWDQGYGWNTYCPEASGGPGGRAYAGCVATAQGQAMKYWNHPPRGIGYHSYWTFDYGTLEVNYAEQTYNWSAIAEGSSTTGAALLLYHCGVSVDMQYAADGSGTYTELCEGSLENYFRYKETAEYLDKDDHTNAEWIIILKEELDNGRPMIYSGHSTQYGHAFNCDGYNSSDYFHFNFGWSGYQNGYFSLSSVNGFNQGQGAIVGMEPDYNYIAENLEATADGNDVVLTWEILESDKKSLLGFTVFRDDTQIGDMLSAGTFTYTDSELENDTYSYCIKTVYAEGTTNCSDDDNVTVDFVGINDINTDIQIYPNPTTDQINIDLQQNQKYEIQINDITGKTIINEQGIKTKLTYDLSNLDKGVYIINIILENNTLTEKIVIQ